MAIEYKTIEVDDNPDKVLNLHAADNWRMQSLTRGTRDSVGNWQNRGFTIVMERERGYVDDKEVAVAPAFSGRRKK